MSGILGVVPSVENQVFEQALDTLTHRGKDNKGIWEATDESILLGNTRLAVLDTSEKGNQPMHFNRFVMVFDGTVYNFLEIRKELVGKGHKFESDTDTEVVLAAYLVWGEDCLLKFNGEWALAIWDKEQKELFLARDRFGVKPLYYTWIGERFAFASEMKALLPFMNSIEISEDFDWIIEHKNIYEATDKCLIKNIKRFPAAHIAIVVPGRMELRRWWNTLEQLPKVIETYEKQVDYFRDILIDACKIRMRADTPIGAISEGDIDSSFLVGAMSQIVQKPSPLETRLYKDFNTLFIANNNQNDAEIAQLFKLQTHTITLDPLTVFSNLENTIYSFEELNISLDTFVRIEIFKQMNELGIKVGLDNCGADILLGGVDESIASAFGDTGFNLKKIFALWNLYSENTDGNVLDFFTKKSEKELKNNELFKGIGWDKLDNFAKKIYIQFAYSLLPSILQNRDKTSMMSGVELRMPFLDWHLVCYALALPWDSKLRKGYTKSILRDAAKSILPENICNNKTKNSFEIPLIIWLKNQWKPFIQDLINSQNFIQNQRQDSAIIKKKIEGIFNNSSTKSEDLETVWNALLIYFWRKGFIK